MAGRFFSNRYVVRKSDIDTIEICGSRNSVIPGKTGVTYERKKRGTLAGGPVWKAINIRISVLKLACLRGRVWTAVRISKSCYRIKCLSSCTASRHPVVVIHDSQSLGTNYA